MMYHLTPVENVGSIEENGLEARPLNAPVREQTQTAEFNHATGRVEQDAEFAIHREGVYLTANEEDARRYAGSISTEKFWDGDEHELALLAVDVSPRDENVFDDPELINPDDHITASGRVFVDGIPAEDVNHVETVVA